MSVVLSPKEERMERAYQPALVIVSAIVLTMSFPQFAFTEVNSKGTRSQTPTLVAPPTEQKIAGPVAKKPHKLIHRPATTATTTLQTSSTINQPSPTNTTKMAEAPIGRSLDGATAQNHSKDSFANNATAPTAFAVPLSSPLVGQTATGVGTTRSSSSLVGSATRAAAVAPASSTPAASPSMRRLFSEIPGAVQIMAYENKTPAGTTPTILRNPTAMSFSAVQNGALPAAQTLTISNGGTGTATWTASSNSTWMTLNETSSVAGSNLGSITVTANPSGLAVGSRSGIITIVGPGVANSPQTVTVTFDITAAPTPTIGLSANTLTFTATQGGTNPVAKTISITNSGSGTLSWAATKNSSWLNINPASGTGTGTLSVSVDATGMTAGTYSTPITITASGATNTPNTILVNFTVTPLPAPTTSTATLTWNANTETDLASYKVYKATASGAYATPLATIPAGNLTYQATGLAAGTTYYFIITAVDTAGNESTFSNEVSKSIF